MISARARQRARTVSGQSHTKFSSDLRPFPVPRCGMGEKAIGRACTPLVVLPRKRSTRASAAKSSRCSWSSRVRSMRSTEAARVWNRSLISSAPWTTSATTSPRCATSKTGKVPAETTSPLVHTALYRPTRGAVHALLASPTFSHAHFAEIMDAQESGALGQPISLMSSSIRGSYRCCRLPAPRSGDRRAARSSRKFRRHCRETGCRSVL